MKKALIFAIIMMTTLVSAGCGGKMPANNVNSADDMKGRGIGVILNSAATAYADGIGTLHNYASGDAMLIDLKNGAIDCAIMVESAAKTLVSQVPDLRILSKPFVKDDFCFAVAKENPDLTKAVNGALKTLDDNGTIKKIIDGYSSENGYKYTSPDKVDLSAGTLTLAVDNHFQPYSYDDGEGHTVGIDIDIAHAVCDLLHVQMKIAIFEKSSLITTVEYGKADLAPRGLTNDENDAKLVDFSKTFLTCTLVILTRK